MIPYSRQHIDEEDIQAVLEVLKSDWLTQGPKVLAFEKALAEYSGARFAVAVPNGTAALYLAYKAAGLKEEDEIITSPNTFVATANMALACGAKPVFCDTRTDTYNIDETKIEDLITEKTKAIVPVHFAGHPCEMDEISRIAQKHNLLVIEDACHAIGAEYRAQKIGSLSDLTVFSFHPVKPITTGEGGAILTDNESYYKKMLSLRTHGIVKDPAKTEAIGKWYYEMVDLGFNNRITDFQCALGISQLKKLDGFQEKREAVANYYFEKLAEVKSLILPTKLAYIKHSWHLFPIRLKDAGKRRATFDALQTNGIGVQVHYIPVHFQPYYQKLGYPAGTYPNAEAYYNSAISLPIYPDLTKADQNKVIEVLLASC
ncbi:MAG: UDP-4-amino-4,6-dideoxy-N-acetyl-beta-L-altrosamine transaminase [Candidatus Harrisonbacteria bacterium RIFCSPLOWO2_02_FULL_45_10c]|uniref:UDP-4-amino-4, 6-dideoxy-N-acetyl-beta-L-altrosamine transaminase n=1 Tax=Candidatus Harrisonbacteria bacterium RIFCSPLOWO2_02_FULL_45_10c TaxID=1798410 RepID=A0A1G1ZSI0_9BACT|nr:MAG: UDP-4-amino-4,6-dideoxy-N-acetyl-beta-L-altrosamine transaminase [Candidatus Harrisonbacteria bacterium RIFCSPLOWO2_02_FULL_45_10c]